MQPKEYIPGRKEPQLEAQALTHPQEKCSGKTFFNQTRYLSLFPITCLQEKEKDFMFPKCSQVFSAANLNPCVSLCLNSARILILESK